MTVYSPLLGPGGGPVSAGLLIPPGVTNGRDHGMLGDGIHDDCDGLTAAIAAVTPVQGTVLVPPSTGAYVIGCLVTIPAGVTVDFSGAEFLLATGGGFRLGGPGATLQGAPGRSVMRFSSDANHIDMASDSWVTGFRLAGDYTTLTQPDPYTLRAYGVDRPHIRELVIDGISGVSCNTATNVDIDGVEVINHRAPINPFVVYASTGGWVRRVTVRGIVVPCAPPYISPRLLCILQSHNIDVEGCEVSDCDASAAAPFLGSAGGITVMGGDHVTLTGCSGRNNIAIDAVAVEMGADSVVITGGQFTGNGNAEGQTPPTPGFPYQNGDGIDLYNCSNVRVVNVDCRNNGNYSLHSSQHVAFECENVHGLDITNADASDAGLWGISFTGCTATRIAQVTASRSWGAGMMIKASQDGLTQTDITVSDSTFNDCNRGLDGGINNSGVYIADSSRYLLRNVTACDTRVGAARTQALGVTAGNLSVGEIDGGLFMNNTAASDIACNVWLTMRVDVRYFGAQDGSLADIAPLVRRAYIVAATIGSPLIFPAGCAFVCGSVYLDGVVVIEATGATITYPANTPPTYGQWIWAQSAADVTVRGGVWKGQGTTQTVGCDWLGAAYGGGTVTVEGVDVRDIYGCGVQASGANDLTVRGSRFASIQNTAVANFVGDTAPRPQRTTVVDNAFFAVTNPAWAPATVNIGRVDEVTVARNRFRDCFSAVALELCTDTDVSHNRIRACGEGIRISNSDHMVAGESTDYDAVVVGNTLRDMTSTSAPAISVRGHRVLIGHNTIRTTAFMGIDVSSGATAVSGVAFTSGHVTIAHNRVRGVFYDGISLAANAAGTSVTEVDILGNVSEGNGRHGLSFATAIGSIAGVRVRNNVFAGNAAANVQYYLSGGRTAQVTYSDNIGYAPGRFRVAEYGAVGDVSVDDTAAIQAATNDCIAHGGGVVEFDDLTYAVTTIEYDSGVTFEGVARTLGATVLYQFSGTRPVFAPKASRTGGMEHVVFRRLFVSGYGNQVNNAGGIDLAGVIHGRVEECRISTTRLFGVRVTGYGNGASGDGMYCVVTDNLIENLVAASSPVAVLVEGVAAGSHPDGAIIERNTVSVLAGTAFRVRKNGAALAPDSVVIRDNRTIAVSDVVDLEGNYTLVAGNRFEVTSSLVMTVTVRAGSDGSTFRDNTYAINNSGTPGALTFTDSGTRTVRTDVTSTDKPLPTLLRIGDGAAITRHLSGTKPYDWPSVANGAVISTTVTVTGAAVGDTVNVGHSVAVPAGALLVGAVTAANTVTVTLANFTGAPLDLASGTLRADVWQH